MRKNSATFVKAFACSAIVWALSCNFAAAQWFFPFQSQRSYAPSNPPQSDWQRAPFFDETDERMDSKAQQPVAPTVNYCVRTCDGRYFPIAQKNSAAKQACSALCPTAKTGVFSGNSIEQSISADGARYMALPAALAYRTEIVPDCTCNGKDAFGLTNVSLEKDSTLRAGDIVVENKRISNFQGGVVPHKQSAFKTLDRARLPAHLKRQLFGAKIAPATSASTPKAATIPQTPLQRAERIVTPGRSARPEERSVTTERD